MIRHNFHAEQWLPYPIEVVFAFFANPANLPRLMPGWQHARIEEAHITAPPPFPDPGLNPEHLTPAQPDAAGAGTHLTLSFRPFPYSPIRVSWDARITEFVWNDRFCDHQVRGPFRYWQHCHKVRSKTRTASNGVAQPGTLLHDHVEYEAPLGPLGELANRLVIWRQLRSTFAYRQKRTLEILQASTTVPRNT